jgi:hypothetical protein
MGAFKNVTQGTIFKIKIANPAYTHINQKYDIATFNAIFECHKR